MYVKISCELRTLSSPKQGLRAVANNETLDLLVIIMYFTKGILGIRWLCSGSVTLALLTMDALKYMPWL